MFQFCANYRVLPSKLHSRCSISAGQGACVRSSAPLLAARLAKNIRRLAARFLPCAVTAVAVKASRYATCGLMPEAVLHTRSDLALLCAAARPECRPCDTHLQVPAYVVEPRDRSTFGGNTLLLIPDMTGVANPQNRELAGARMCRPMSDVSLKRARSQPLSYMRVMVPSHKQRLYGDRAQRPRPRPWTTRS